VKKVISLILLFIPFIIMGCITIYRYDNIRYTPTNENEIEVYSTTLPQKSYIEIAEIVLEDSKSVHKLKKEAAKLGADAIIIIGSASISSYVGVWSGWGSSESVESGRKAIAIKYTNQGKTE
jgi:hypothetical protein